MRELRNSFDKEVAFENLEEAKKYYLPKDNEIMSEADFLGDNYEEFCIDFKSYQKAIEEAESLEELADVLNSWADRMGNGSEYYVKEF